MKLPTTAQVTAFGRHVVSYAMGVVTTAAVLHVVDQPTADQATNAISQISSGVAQIVAGVSTLISVGAGLWAAWRASPLSQLIAVANNPQVKEVAASPSLADAAAHDKIVAK